MIAGYAASPIRTVARNMNLSGAQLSSTQLSWQLSAECYVQVSARRLFDKGQCALL